MGGAPKLSSSWVTILISLASSLVTAAAVVFSGLASTYGDLASTDATNMNTILEGYSVQLERAYKRIEDLETRMTQVTTELAGTNRARVEDQIKIAELQSRVNAKFDPLVTIRRLLDDFPSPAWFKAEDDHGEIRMVIINEKYEQVYKRSAELYEGLRDRDVYPLELAIAYEEHDRQVLDTKNDIEFIEEVERFLPDGTVVTKLARIWKIYHETIDSTVGIIGVEVSPLNNLRADSPELPLNRAVEEGLIGRN